MIKLSHSGMNRYHGCAHAYKLRYIDKLVSQFKGSALYFGSAIDNALNHMLEFKDKEGIVQESKSIFLQNWLKQKDNKYDLVDLPINPDIVYLKSDFNLDLLGEDDLKALSQILPGDITELRENIETRKKDLGWANLLPEERSYYNYSNWLCLKNKAELFIDAYYKEIIPQIKRTISVQNEVNLSDGDGSEIVGFVDAVVELHDGRVVILDNKTSSMKYSEDSVKNSVQLGLYQAILNTHCQTPNHPWKVKIDACAYAVLSKKLTKETTKTCKICGTSVISGHAKCNVIIGKKRCNGEFTKTYKFTVPTQFLVDNIPETLEDEVLQNADNITECIKQNYFPQNFDSCIGIYGKCEYYNLCHEGLLDGLIDIKDKKK